MMEYQTRNIKKNPERNSRWNKLGAFEAVGEIILASPDLVLINDVKTFRQNGESLVVSQSRIDHQRRQIARRDAEYTGAEDASQYRGAL
jgi:hypothetical protein